MEERDALFLRGDDNHAMLGLVAVEIGSGLVFRHRHFIDGLGIDVLHILGIDDLIVDDDQWCLCGADGSHVIVTDSPLVFHDIG